MRVLAFVVVAASLGMGCATDSQPQTDSTDGFEASTVASSSTDQAITTISDASASSSEPTSTLASPLATTTTTEPSPAEPIVVLESDGLGIVSFGDRMEAVLPILIDLVGSPTFDDVQTDVMNTFDPASGDAIPFGYYRRVGWSHLGLYLEFVDWDINREPLDHPVFSFWTAVPSEETVGTADGVGPGVLWADAVAVYGDQASATPEAPCDQYPVLFFFTIQDDDGRWFRGQLSGEPAEPMTFITGMSAGVDAFAQGC